MCNAVAGVETWGITYWGSALGAGESECEAVLHGLHRRRLVMRTDDGYIAVGGIGVRHD